jgi:hypothetical protein
MRVATLTDLRSGALARQGKASGSSGRDEGSSAWSHGRGEGSGARDTWDAAPEAEPEVPVASLKDFLGDASISRTSSGKPPKGEWGASTGKSEWDPFDKSAASSTPQKPASHPPSPAPTPASAHTSAVGGGLRPPPTGSTGHRGSMLAHAPAPAPFQAPPVTSVSDDLAGLMLGGGTASKPAAATPFGFDDPFAAPSAPAPAPSTSVDIFSMPVPANPAGGYTYSLNAPAPAPKAGVLEGGLIDLDNLTAAKTVAPVSVAPSLSQLKATTVQGGGPVARPAMNVMGGNTTGLGFSPLDMYTPTVPSGGPTGPYGAPPGGMYGAPHPYGAPPNPYGGHPNPYGGAPNPYGAAPNPYGGPAPFGAPYGAPRPAAPAPADYNPFA